METSLKEKIILLRKEGKSYNEIVKDLKCSKATISYHCKNSMLNNIGLNEFKILTANEIKELREFYKNNTLKDSSIKFGVSISTVKKYCDNKFSNITDDDRRKLNYIHVKTFRKRNKKRAVEYKGGKCVLCGYNRCIRAFDFHHLDPGGKDFHLSQNMNKAWLKVKIELDKCILVCSNCHREIHDGLHNEKDLYIYLT